MSLRHLLIGIVMLAASGAAIVLKPTQRLAEMGSRVVLEEMIPQQFGEWRLDTSIIPLKVSPDVQKKLDTIYSQTLSRTYVNAKGEKIMLSIAYGEDQRDSMQMHYPEICYPSQGFQTQSIRKEQLGTPFGTIEVKRLEMVRGERYEPVTYWIMIGEYVALGGVDKKLNELRYSLRGSIPDGLLFRISSISQDPEKAYHNHDEFVSALLNTLSPHVRRRVVGL